MKFFLKCYSWDATSENRLKLDVFWRNGISLAQNFRYKGSQSMRLTDRQKSHRKTALHSMQCGKNEIRVKLEVLLLLLLLKSVKVDDDVALLLSCAVLGSMCTQVTLQSTLGGTGSAAVRTLWTCLRFCCGRMTRGLTFEIRSRRAVTSSNPISWLNL